MTVDQSRAASFVAKLQAHRVAVSLAMVALVVAISVLLVLLSPMHDRETYRQFASYGYLGVFVVTLIGTAAVVVPVPYLVTVMIAGTFLNPVAVAVVAGVAAAIGELVGYVAGFASNTLLPDARWVHLLERAMKRFGALVVFIAAFIPNPFFDAVGVIAGVTRTSIWVFVGSCFAGKTLRFWLVAAGSNAFLRELGHPNLFG